MVISPRLVCMTLPLTSPKSCETSVEIHIPEVSAVSFTSCCVDVAPCCADEAAEDADDDAAFAVFCPDASSLMNPGVTSYAGSSMPGVEDAVMLSAARAAPARLGPLWTISSPSHAWPSTLAPMRAFVSASELMRVIASCSSCTMDMASYPPRSAPVMSMTRKNHAARVVPALMFRTASEQIDRRFMT